jgi:hypothetical protein
VSIDPSVSHNTTPPPSRPTPKRHFPGYLKSAKEQLLHVEACDIGIAEGGARTHDLEVDLFAVNKSHTLYRLSYPGKGHDLMKEGKHIGYKKRGCWCGTAGLLSWDHADFSGTSAVEFGAGWPGKRRRHVRLLFWLGRDLESIGIGIGIGSTDLVNGQI